MCAVVRRLSFIVGRCLRCVVVCNCLQLLSVDVVVCCCGLLLRFVDAVVDVGYCSCSLLLFGVVVAVVAGWCAVWHFVVECWLLCGAWCCCSLWLLVLSLWFVAVYSCVVLFAWPCVCC